MNEQQGRSNNEIRDVRIFLRLRLHQRADHRAWYSYSGCPRVSFTIEGGKTGWWLRRQLQAILGDLGF